MKDDAPFQNLLPSFNPARCLPPKAMAMLLKTHGKIEAGHWGKPWQTPGQEDG